MKRHTAILLAVVLVPCAARSQSPTEVIPLVVSFPSGGVTLRGTLYRPEGEGPFPAVLYNHGSAPGNLNDLAFDQLGPLFAQRGWLFFAPYRRGQGLSVAAGPYVNDEIRSVASQKLRSTLPPILVLTIATIVALLIRTRGRRRWIRASAAAAVGLLGVLVSLMVAANARTQAIMQVLQTSHLADHLAAYEWVNGQRVVDPARIATAGNSFGGIISVVAARQIPYCAAIGAAGGAETWSTAVAAGMTEAVRQSQAPIFLFQAANDYSLAPTQRLGDEMRKSSLAHEVKIYPPFGNSAADGHSFAWRGSAVWADDVFRFLDAHCG